MLGPYAVSYGCIVQGMAVSQGKEEDGTTRTKPRKRNLRKKRKLSSSSSESEGEEHALATAVVSKGKKQLGDKNAMAFSTRRKQDTEHLSGMAFESSGMDARHDYLVNDATRVLDMPNEGERGAGRDQGSDKDATGDGTTYKGMKGYKDYREGFRREDERGGLHGPKKPSANFRMSVLVDYQPDVCKDYKETGYCGFGDSCKFLHDRGDYKAGWQLDRDWEEEQKARKERERQGWVDNDEESDEESDDDLPFACFICREPWEKCQDPVVTKCGHYFCEQCALKENAKTGKCFVCGEPTKGIFNVAHAIIKREKAKSGG